MSENEKKVIEDFLFETLYKIYGISGNRLNDCEVDIQEIKKIAITAIAVYKLRNNSIKGVTSADYSDEVKRVALDLFPKEEIINTLLDLLQEKNEDE